MSLKIFGPWRKISDGFIRLNYYSKQSGVKFFPMVSVSPGSHILEQYFIHKYKAVPRPFDVDIAMQEIDNDAQSKGWYLL